MRKSRKNVTRREGKLSFAYLSLLVSFAFAALLFCSASLRVPQNQTARIGRLNARRSTAALATQGNFSAAEERPLGRRRLFPYSVIPRGVESKQELKNVIAQDPVVRAHYAGFNVAKTHIVRLDHDRVAYVSYRLGNVVFWTKRRLKIPAGETLITDGESMARARCGNRLSVSAEAPVSPEEPSAAAFETPQDDSLLVAYNPPLELPLTPPLELPLTPPTAVLKPVQNDLIFIPSSIWFPVEGSRASGMRVTPPAPPPIVVPEPGTLLLLSTGFSAIWLTRKRRRR